MKIGMYGNMANDGFVVAKALREMGVDCQLYVGFPQHIASLPQWEVCDLGMKDVGPNPYVPDWEGINNGFEKPDWLHFFNIKTTYRLKPLKLLSLLPAIPAWAMLRSYRYIMRELIWKVRYRPSEFIIETMKQFDVNVCHLPHSIYGERSKKPYIPFDAGAIRYLRGYYMFPYQQIRMSMLEEAYRMAPLIFATNIDTFHLFEKYGLNQTVFMPFLIDTEYYKPLKVENKLPYEYVIFHPARQYWREKANHLMIKAFHKFHKEEPDSVLVIVDWSDDREKTRNLIKKLGLEKDVIYLGLMSKPRLIKWYNRATVVADQFLLKGMGTTVSEAMACGKPVIISTSKEMALKAYGDVPPILHADSSERIFNQLVKCTDKGFRKKVGAESRRWVLKHHSPEVVAKRHLELYEKVVN